MSKRRMPKIGLALGSGPARGWSHIGVIKALADIGIEPDIVSGCSIGSVVGAAYVSGRLDQFEEWVRSLTRMDVARFFELDFSLSGFVDVERLQGFFDDYVMDAQATIDSLERSLPPWRQIWRTAARSGLPKVLSMTPSGRPLRCRGFSHRSVINSVGSWMVVW